MGDGKMSWMIAAMLVAAMLPGAAVWAQYNWEPQPEKAALMLVHAHPDDEGQYFGGAITYYAACRKLPVVVITMTTTSWIAERKDEMRCAIWTYGMRNPPIFADFPDNCYNQTLQCAWDGWGGKDRVVSYLTGQMRKYKPDVVLCHDFDGEYGHPNHMASGIAAAEAFGCANDPSKYPEQLDTVGLWEPKKCYVHLLADNPFSHNWSMTCDELGGRTPSDVTYDGLQCHVSQGLGRSPNYAEYDCRVWGLYATNVGPDVVAQDDFFENVDVSIYHPSGAAGGDRHRVRPVRDIPRHAERFTLTGRRVAGAGDRPGVVLCRTSTGETKRMFQGVKP